MNELFALTHQDNFLHILLLVSFVHQQIERAFLCANDAVKDYAPVTLCCNLDLISPRMNTDSLSPYLPFLSLCAFLNGSEWVLRCKNAPRWMSSALLHFALPVWKLQTLSAPSRQKLFNRSTAAEHTKACDQSPAASDGWWQHRDKGDAANKMLRAVIIKVQSGEESGRSTDVPASRENSRVVSLTALLVYDNYDICV